MTNILERALVLCHEEQIDLVHLPPEVAAAGRERPAQRAEEHGAAQLYYADEPGGGALKTSRPASDRSGEGKLPGEWLPHLKPSERSLLSSAESATDGGLRVARRLAREERMRPEVRRLLQALDAQGWRRAETARALGISRSTLWRRMKDYGLL